MDASTHARDRQYVSLPSVYGVFFRAHARTGPPPLGGTLSSSRVCVRRLLYFYFIRLREKKEH